MATRRPTLRKLALAVCRGCGIRPSDVEDAAAEIMHQVWRRPRGGRYATAVETIRRRLARQLGVPRRSLPGDIRRLKAIGDYEDTRERYRLNQAGDEEAWPRSFDRHSRRFAIENGVCPRCSRPGEFAEAAGRCDCGFGYGRQPEPGSGDGVPIVRQGGA